jgi:nitroreductase
MKIVARLAITCFLIGAASVGYGEVVAESKVWNLPDPQKEGGMPLLTALANRQSGRSYADKEIPEQVLSNLLWAAFGINRPESGKRTAPSSYNWQDVQMYVFTEKGVWTYDALRHALIPVKSGDHRKLAGLQSFVWTAPLSIVYVSDQSTMEQDGQSFSDDYKLRISGIDTGHVSQNVYLFCASEGLSVVARASVDGDAFSKAFDLPAFKKVMLGQTVGYPDEEE